MIKINPMDKIVFQYDTGPVPPPFCFRFSIELIKQESGIFHGVLALEYYDREELSQDEILDEGFTLDDDYSWTGEVPGVWSEEIERRLTRAQWKKKVAPEDDGSELAVKVVSKGVSELKHPADTDSWLIFLQEIIQVIFELSNKEAPLVIRFVSLQGSRQERIDFNYIFARRVVEIGENNTVLSWEEGQKLLKYIFGFDFLPENAMDKVPKRDGNYLSPGDGLWYNLMENASEKKAAERVKKLEDLLLGYR